ncbi:hypothetical protein C7B62_24865 [Pleurocapsa sp. CCALA 161]|uniref:hypothetical protein n=1 Tax=Pleurocapsa sp. CCALA 161 TaxID=2107688 RepID=UPI000D076107|nr:hypothetical protein [Pleurocapsa sp. CCALA 161]PSB05604.1 hypothetical protein C7B62_24865 [Pleurocapsa sp. CCALA 161]
MASFTYQEIFGNDALGDPDEIDGYIVKISKNSFFDTDNYGELPIGVGLNSNVSPNATQTLYGILMILMQNQGATVNTDPTQKVYITDAGKSIATGERDGQVRRSFTVSFYLDAGLAGIPSVDQIDPQVN